MYLYHFGLRELPFTLTPNTQFYLELPCHKEALEVLTVALKTGEGFIKITGEVGTGKTLLCRLLLNSLPDAFVTAYIPNPYLQPQELRLAFAQELGIAVSAVETQHQLTQLIQNEVMALSQAGKAVVLLVDEAQALPDETLEALRLFTNLETESRKLIQVVLFGQPELETRIGQTKLRQVKQRISFAYELRHLSASETHEYLNHRMTIAGYNEGEMFSAAVCNVIHAATLGVPRLINIVGHKCLMLCYGQNLRRVTAEQVRLAIDDTESLHVTNKPMLLAKHRYWLTAACIGLLGGVVLMLGLGT